MRTRRRIAAALVVALGSGLLAGCGVPLDGAARPIALDALPPTLLAPYSHIPPFNERSLGTAHFTLYFLSARSGLLVQVRRATNGAPTPAVVLDYLDKGPFTAESDQGITTALSQSPQPSLGLSLNPKTGLATVTLDSTFNSIIGVQLYEALGQIVYTLTQQGEGLGVKKVTFLFDGITENYLPSGRFTLLPVGRSQYKALAPSLST